MPLFGWLWTLRMPHVHMLLVGWTVQLAFGVAFWILPRLDAQNNRGNVALMWLCYPALNAGVLLASLPDPLRGRLPSEVLAVAAGILYLLATLTFVLHAWRRVLPFRSIPRRERS